MMNTGLLAEAADETTLFALARGLRRLGYERLDAFTPCDVPGLRGALGLRRSPFGWLVFGVGVTGALVGYLIQWWTNARDYPLDVGGRPAHAIPAFIPITFDTAVLFAGAVAFFGFFIAARLPRVTHPVFDVEGFERASIDRYFVGVDYLDPLFDRERTRREMLQLGALRVAPVGHLPLDGSGRPLPDEGEE